MNLRETNLSSFVFPLFMRRKPRALWKTVRLILACIMHLLKTGWPLPRKKGRERILPTLKKKRRQLLSLQV